MKPLFGKDKEFALILLPRRKSNVCARAHVWGGPTLCEESGCHGHSKKNSGLSGLSTFLTPGEKRVGLCFILILASDHIMKKCFALLL